MRRTVLAVVVVSVLAGCSSGSGTPAARTTTTAASTAPTSAASTTTPPGAPGGSTPAAAATTSTCSLPDKGNIIVLQKDTGLTTDVMELGGTDPAHCHWTFDTLKTSSPTGPGYCTQAAWASDNPGYDVDARPAAPLKNIQVVIGACGQG